MRQFGRLTATEWSRLLRARNSPLPPWKIDHTPGFYVRYAFRKLVRVLYVPFQSLRKDEGDKTNGLTSPLNDAIIITASIIYYPPHNTHTHTPSPLLLHRRSFNWVNRTAVKIRSPSKLSFRWLIWKRWSSVIRSRIFYSSLSLTIKFIPDKKRVEIRLGNVHS